MNILIIDEDLRFLELVESTVDATGHEATTARNFRQAQKHLNEKSFQLILLDIDTDNGNGLDYLKQLTQHSEYCRVVACTENATIGDAVDAMSRDAYTFLQKPLVPDQIRDLVEKVHQDPVDAPEDEPPTGPPESSQQAQTEILLESNEPAVREVLDIIDKSAKTDASILLLGPSGTGKTVMARHIHQSSRRADKALVTVSCPSLSGELLESELFGYVKGAFTSAVRDTEGKVHAAEGGTLFLDEIGELPLELQPKLLRLLQDQQYERVGDTQTRQADIRLITATNRDIDQEVAENRFREDLLFRLNVITIHMPALKDRPRDLPMLIDWFLEHYRRKHNRPELTIEDEARGLLLNYSWPGNLREMGNVIERCVILSDQEPIAVDDLPEAMRGEEERSVEVGKAVALSEIEEAHILKIIESARSLEEAAEILGIDTATLYRKRKKMGLI